MPSTPGARHLAESKIWQAHQSQRDATTVTLPKPSVIAYGVPLYQAAAAHDGQGDAAESWAVSFLSKTRLADPAKVAVFSP